MRNSSATSICRVTTTNQSPTKNKFPLFANGIVLRPFSAGGDDSCSGGSGTDTITRSVSTYTSTNRSGPLASTPRLTSNEKGL